MKERLKNFHHSAVFICLVLAIVLDVVLEALGRHSLFKAISYVWNQPLIFLYNCSIIFFTLTLSLLMRKRIFGYCVISFAWLILGITNCIVLGFRITPFSAIDMLMARNTITIIDKYFNVWQIVLIAALLFVALAAIIVLFIKSPTVTGNIYRTRTTVFIVATFFCVMLFTKIALNAQTISDNFANLATAYNNYGFVYCFSNSVVDVGIGQPSDYSEDKMLEIKDDLDSVGTTDSKLGKDKPNVIFVQLESFMDPSYVKCLTFNENPIPNFTKLKEECTSGFLTMPAIGAGTANSEFEVLTGLRSQYVVNPYSMGLPPVSSLASVLRDRGYEATAIHWYNGVYYNRYHNLRMLGFDSFFTLDTTVTPFEKKGMFVSDEEHYRAILHQLSETEGRDFIFCLTMQNHGGYDYDDFRITYGAQTPFSNQVSDRTCAILTNYCWLLEQSDAALESFITQLSDLDEPTMVVFFSDHIPPLGTDVYEEIGISATGDAGHLTPYFIWSNDGGIAPGETNLYSWQLGAYALTLAGMNDDPFFAYVERLREAADDPAPGDLTAGAERDPVYDLLSYDVLFGNQYAYDEGGLSPENEDFQIGGAMTLEGFDVAEIAGEVYFRPQLDVFDQAYLLEINGVLREMGRIPADSRQELALRCVLMVGDKCYNESNPLVYAGAQELLEAGTPMAYDTYPLWETDFELVENSRGYDIYKSTDAYPVSGGTALVAAGTHWEKQPTYGLMQTGQYSVDADGHVWVVLNRSDLADRDPAALLEDLGATLYAFEP